MRSTTGGARCDASSSQVPDARFAPVPICRGVTIRSRDGVTPAQRLKLDIILSCAACGILHCPIVTSVNGAAAGAGMSFALMGDMILCARSSYFLQAFRRIGLVPDCGSTWLLPRLIGKARSVELSLMGERLPAEKALEWGLVNRVYDDAALMDETMKLARELANGPTIALSLIRKLYWDSPGNSFEDQLDLEQQLQRVAGSAEDFKEGVTAFLEKRPAKFKGK